MSKNPLEVKGLSLQDLMSISAPGITEYRIAPVYLSEGRLVDCPFTLMIDVPRKTIQLQLHLPQGPSGSKGE